MGKAKLLLVDDDPINLLSLSKNLQDAYHICKAENGVEALKQVDEFEPDLILLDIMMPEMNGLEVCKRIRANQSHNHRKIIFLTGKGNLDDLVQGYEVGGDDYLIKPFRSGELMAKIRVFLKLKRMEEIDQLKSHVLSFFSHEANTPLTTISGFVQYLQADPSIEPKARDEIYNKILTSAAYLSEFVQKALLLCQLKNGGEMIGALINLNDIFSIVLKKREGVIQSKKHQLKVSIPDSQNIPGEPRLIQMALENLLDNCIRYSPEGSEIRIKCEKEGFSQKIIFQNPGQLPPHEENYLFNELIAPRLMHHKSGQRLSLVLSRQIFRNHGGDLHFLSEYEKGWLTFQAVLPALTPD